MFINRPSLLFLKVEKENIFILFIVSDTPTPLSPPPQLESADIQKDQDNIWVLSRAPIHHLGHY